MAVIDQFWGESYLQRTQRLPSARAVLKEALKDMAAGMTYEIGMVIAEDDLVAIHGRYTGWGRAPLIVAECCFAIPTTGPTQLSNRTPPIYF